MGCCARRRDLSRGLLRQLQCSLGVPFCGLARGACKLACTTLGTPVVLIVEPVPECASVPPGAIESGGVVGEGYAKGGRRVRDAHAPCGADD